MKIPLVVGNWKMHGSQSECVALATAVVKGLGQKVTRCEVALAPPVVALATVAKAISRTRIKLAAQNCHWQDRGAFTGEVSPPMVKELGCDFVILGHSERRHVFNESDDLVARKVSSVVRHGLRAILCVGETSGERQRRQTTNVITRQLRSALKGLTKDAIESVEIAYEPVWAIGTGQNATPEQVSQVHKRIRSRIVSAFGDGVGKKVRILYGGSVNPENANGLAYVDDVDGFLVGGASLKAETFLPIVRSFDGQRII